MTARRVTFVVTRDGDIDAFESIELAASYVEGYDVKDGEYDLFCTVDGERLEPWLLDEVRVDLRPTGEDAQAQLGAYLRKHAGRNRLNSIPPDPQAVASELLGRRGR